MTAVPGVTALLLAGTLVACGPDAGNTRYPIPGEYGPHITVEVLNGTNVDGLARRVTFELRRRGLDVVYFGSAASPVDSTRILIRRGDSSAARRVQEALRTGRIIEERDPRLWLDVTVVLGPDAARLDRDP